MGGKVDATLRITRHNVYENAVTITNKVGKLFGR